MGWSGKRFKTDFYLVELWSLCVSVKGFPYTKTLFSCLPFVHESVKLNFRVYTEIGFSDLHQGKLVRGVVSLISGKVSLFCRLQGSNFKLHRLLLNHALNFGALQGIG